MQVAIQHKIKNVVLFVEIQEIESKNFRKIREIRHFQHN